MWKRLELAQLDYDPDGSGDVEYFGANSYAREA